MTNEEKELIKAAKRNLKLMRACKEILEDINKINKNLDGKNKNAINLHQIDRDDCINIFEKYKKENKVIY